MTDREFWMSIYAAATRAGCGRDYCLERADKALADLCKRFPEKSAAVDDGFLSRYQKYLKGEITYRQLHLLPEVG